MGATPLDVSVVVPARNEARNIRALINCIEHQTVPAREVLVLDGCSTDGTWESLQELAKTRPWLKPIRNEDKTIPKALNAGFLQSKGIVVARMDAHARYPPDYLETVIKTFMSHPEAWAVGSAMATVGEGDWGRAIASILRRSIGLGGSAHRIGGAAGPVETVFSGCYLREKVIEAGGFDDALLANEDFELNYRLRTRGGILWLEPTLRSEWYAKDSPGALVRQMARYGYYKALTLQRHPRSLRPRQLAPPAVAGLLLTSVITRSQISVRLSAVYLAAAIALGARAGSQDGASPWRAGLTVPLVHLAWGGGVLAGLVRHGVPRAQRSATASNSPRDRRAR
jgi:glycosyltransferase involved in cell wall biosynthesis